MADHLSAALPPWTRNLQLYVSPAIKSMLLCHQIHALGVASAVGARLLGWPRAAVSRADPAEGLATSSRREEGP